ncbi:ABC transporter permease [Paenibacillus sp. alder61]|uniref:ABC transporter permease n=1 Tax=Paenibacillus sp. alder61 TaxID=2862948 RepID=UPI001CD6D3F5|nr:ABC transporter permease [Paenibacillus sp. alder61]MCA1291492.1 ABC transporter permease [Paenibacillus sp. alder61]
MIRLLRAEWMKLRTFCLVLPIAAAVLLLGVISAFWYMNFRETPGGAYATMSVMYFFLSFTLMLSVTLLTSVMASTEHETKVWNRICTIPVAKPKIYLSKWIVACLLLFIEVSLIIAGTIVLWKLLFHEPAPLEIIVKQPLYCFCAVLAFISIQTWLSTVFANQSIAIGAGAAGSMASLFLARSTFPVLHYMPWTYPALSTPLLPGHGRWVLAGLAVGVVLLAAGCWHFNRKEW